MTASPTELPTSATDQPGGPDQNGTIPGVGASPGLLTALLLGGGLLLAGTALVVVALRRREPAEEE
jgi:hypothetical protein